jgi:CTP:molybdopterin cytidylyltransferase MocA
METILLSAGKSSRMGKNKALLDISGEKVIKILLRKLAPLSSMIYIILGDNFSEVEAYLTESHLLNSKIKLVYNENHLEGMFTSILKGMDQVSGDETIMLQMIDQPFVEINLYMELIEVEENNFLIYQPARQLEDSVKPGHPLIFAPEFKKILLDHRTANDLREIIRAFRDRRKFLFTEDESIFMNLNTPEDVKRYENWSKNGNTIN